MKRQFSVKQIISEEVIPQSMEELSDLSFPQHLSFPRKRESIEKMSWIPAFAGMTQRIIPLITHRLLPPDFASWQTNAIVIDYCTETITAADNKLEVFLYVEGQSGDTLNGTLSAANAKVSSVAAAWTTVAISATELTNALPAGTDWNSANTTAVLVLRPHSMSSKYVRVGDIELNYDR